MVLIGPVAASIEIDQVEASFEYRREFPNKTVPARGCKAGTVDGDSALGGASKARRLLRSKQIKHVPSVRYFAARCCVAPLLRHPIFSGVTCGGIDRWNEFIDRSSI